jgi:2-iminobutanoate/2-iminopropanoate deaminase
VIAMSDPPLRRAIHSARFPKPVASYSQGFQHGNTLFITGPLPVDPSTNAVVGQGDITLESRQVMRNIQLEISAVAIKD